MTVGVTAFLLRAAVAIGLTLIGVEVAPDESLYWHRAGELAAGEASESLFRDQRRGFIFLLAPVYLASGGSLLAGRLVVAALGAATAVVTAVLATELTDSRRVGLLAGLIVAVWPSQVIFSSTALRDALIWLALVTIALCVFRFSSSDLGRAHLRYAGGIVALLYLLAILKPSTMLVAAGALIVAAVLIPRGSRLITAGIAVALVMVIPFAAGWGVAGTERFTPDRVATSIEERSVRSAHACTFIEHDDPVTEPLGAAKRLARGVPAFVAGPYPWTETCSNWGEAAKIESILFVALVAVAVVAGVRWGGTWRRMPFGLALAGGLLLVNGIAQGAIGTAFRHRAEIFWLVAILAAKGLIDWNRGRQVQS